MRPINIFFISFIAIVLIGAGFAFFSSVPSGPSCSPKWECSGWSECLNDRAFRTCTDKNMCGSNVGRPDTSRSCVQNSCGNDVCELGETCSTCSADCGTCNPVCVESWNCTNWTACQGGSQIRTCTDSNQCGTAANRPSQFQSCTQGCTENWFCGNWSQCSNGAQSRTCNDLNSCGTTLNKPTIQQSCTNLCTENWSCAPWGTCTNGTQGRTCTDLNACGTALNKPSQSQSCVNLCTENWSCTAWGTCSNGTQGRTCTDGNACGTTVNKPPESQSCTAPLPLGAITISANFSARSTVFDYPANACDTSVNAWDLPDVVAHAMKDANGRLVLSSGNAPKNYFMFGSNFDNLTRNCTPVLSSPNYDPANQNSPYHVPETFTHQQWVSAIYRLGNVVYGLVHNEYHDPRSLTDPAGALTPCAIGDVFPSNRCWYNSINLVTSTNNARTFTAQLAPNHVIAFPDSQWNAFAKPKTHSSGYNTPLYGYMGPTNIVKKNENGTDFYYAMVAAFPLIPANTRGMCLVRTATLDDPASWRVWDGTGFNLQFQNPYVTGGSVPVCAFIDPTNLGASVDSLTYNTYLNKYVVIGPNHTGTAASCGVYFSTSDDLITWSPKKQILDENGTPLTLSLPNAPCSVPNLSDSYSYTSLIDHNQLNDPTDPNFEKSGNKPYLYIVHFQDDVGGLNRDLIRMPLTICQVNNPAPGCP